jgi:hypothetical protein
MFDVRGRIIDVQTGRPPGRSVLIQMYNVADSGMRSTSSLTTVPNAAYNAMDGSFIIDDVPPGEYIMDVSAPPGIGGSPDEMQRRAQLAPRLRTVLRVKDRDIENLVLTLRSGQVIDGTILLENQNVAAIPDLAGIRPQLRPSYAGRYLAGQRSPLVEPPGAMGAFRLAGVHDGEYLVSVMGVPSGFYLRDVRYGGESALTSPLRFSAGSPSSLEIVLQRGTGEVRGTVTNALGDAVEGVRTVLVPSDRHRWDLYQMATTDRLGRFSIPEVAPGDYKVFSWEALDPNAYLNSDFVATIETQGRAVRVAVSSSIDVNVTVIPAK